MSFLKFFLLGTYGEVIGLRIRTGNYSAPNFGIVPRAIVWGFLGITIKLAFDVFSSGSVFFISNLHLQHFNGTDLGYILNKGPMCLTKIVLAFCISVSLNLIYAPMLMTFHKITDTHIMNNSGKINCLLKPLKMGEILSGMNWNVMWNFVYKKTIPFFWIPAHTTTFLLPPMWRVLFAAFLGIVLGVFMATASLKSRNK
jgi:hypothetical protein